MLTSLIVIADEETDFKGLVPDMTTYKVWSDLNFVSRMLSFHLAAHYFDLALKFFKTSGLHVSLQHLIIII